LRSANEKRQGLLPRALALANPVSVLLAEITLRLTQSSWDRIQSLQNTMIVAAALFP